MAEMAGMGRAARLARVVRRFRRKAAVLQEEFQSSRA
jgi:hypothetical protein